MVFSPRWLEIFEYESHGFLSVASFRVHGWRRGVLSLARPIRPLNRRLMYRWVQGFLQAIPPRDEGPPDAGVREPRRPAPHAGSGAVALPRLDLT